jgi:hypothetical protein
MQAVTRLLTLFTVLAWLGAAGMTRAQTATPPPTSATDLQPPSLSPRVMALITPVRDAILKARTDQARLPPAADDRETLRRLHDLDQAVWLSLSKVDFAKIPDDQKLAAKDLLGSWIQPVDIENQTTLFRILPPEGWFAISRYGADGEEAAYLVVLHSGIDDWRRFAPVVGRFAAVGEANGSHYALLVDRLAVHENRPQPFGSQLTCVAGVYKPYPIEDPEHLDERRLKLGMPSYAAYLKSVAGAAC